MNYIYAMVEWGYYEDNTFAFIKLDKADKEKFIAYSKECESINGDDKESIRLMCFIDGIIESFQKDFALYHIETIHDHQKVIKDQLQLIERLGKRHVLHDKREMLASLLQYEFTPV
jgi:hypothetical protein